jgi:hypothetical protein
MNIKEFTSEQIAMLIAITIGGTVAIINPEYMEMAFNKTILGIILIKIFWN